jgi:S-adenosylmethionine:tRNA ribosyltransferase-isomerase
MITDPLFTDLYEPEAVPFDLLSANIPSDLIRTAYDEAVCPGYFWHEFGDLNLII